MTKEEIISKAIAQNLIKIPGQVRGVAFKTDAEYILKEKIEEDLKKLETELEKLGYPIKYKEIQTMSFYPIGLRLISLLLIKKIFNFDDKKINDIGFRATKKSLIIKLFIQYFLSLRRVFFDEAPKIWQKHYTIGKLIPTELNEERKYGILRLENFNLHPLYCCYLTGYFSGIGHMIIKSPKITVEEIKCVFRGDDCHEFLIKWE